MANLPAWANWNVDPALEPWTVGLEEEVMLLEPDGSPAWRSEDVLRELPAELAEHTRGETHGLALELATNPHATVAAAANELRGMRAGLAETVRALGLRAAVAGTHPTVRSEEVEVSPGARYQYLHASLRELARREPTFALHVHVAVPDAELAVRALNGMRAHIPVLLALSANSPFTRGTDSGLASARTPVFQAFPRTGIPREMDSYADYVEAIDVLIRCGAIPEPTFIWWDVRLQPRFGTLEVRVMDAQTRIRDTAALAALVQCLVRLEALDEPDLSLAPEVIDENRFLAARDGINAQLLDPVPRPLRAGRRAAGHARRRLLAARPRARAASANWRCSRTWPATPARCASARSPPSPKACPGSCTRSRPSSPRRARSWRWRPSGGVPAGLSRPGREVFRHRRPGLQGGERETRRVQQHLSPGRESVRRRAAIPSTGGRNRTDSGRHHGRDRPPAGIAVARRARRRVRRRRRRARAASRVASLSARADGRAGAPTARELAIARWRARVRLRGPVRQDRALLRGRRGQAR